MYEDKKISQLLYVVICVSLPSQIVKELFHVVFTIPRPSRFHKGFATLGTDVNPRSVGMQMFSHGRIIAKHFSAPFVRTGNGSGNFFTTISLRLDPCKLGELLWIGEIKSRNTSGWQLLPSHVLGVVRVRLVRRDHVIKAGHIGFLVVI